MDKKLAKMKRIPVRYADDRVGSFLTGFQTGLLILPELAVLFNVCHILNSGIHIQYICQRCRAAGMGSGNRYLIPFCLIYGTVDHLVGDCIGKKDHQIRCPQFFLKSTFFFHKYLCLTSVFSADLFILTDHTFIASYNDNTHRIPPFPNLPL